MEVPVFANMEADVFVARPALVFLDIATKHHAVSTETFSTHGASGPFSKVVVAGFVWKPQLPHKFVYVM